MSHPIDDIKESKNQLRSDICKLIYAFVKDNHVTPSNIEINIHTGTLGDGYEEILNIEVNMEIKI